VSSPSVAPSPSRAPLDAAVLAAAAAAVGLDLTVVDEIDSTNAELIRVARAFSRRSSAEGHPPQTADGAERPDRADRADRADREVRPGALATGADPWPVAHGVPDRLVLVAEWQAAGRGRLDRSWVSPPRAGLTVSLLLRPAVPAAALGWMPLVVGMALVGTLRSRLAVPAVLKWPNDVLIDGAKLAGVLVELVPTVGVGQAAVVGFGLNVTTTAAELPPGGTSLLECGAVGLDRTILLEALLTGLVAAWRRWELDPPRARDAYRKVCATLGRTVRVELPDGSHVFGIASDVDEAGRLVVGGRPFSVGDVKHLR
jgi:BirA family biotin operon repressor/biotin-[acetyl-CoA-carboxylase] ligase